MCVCVYVKHVNTHTYIYIYIIKMIYSPAAPPASTKKLRQRKTLQRSSSQNTEQHK